MMYASQITDAEIGPRTAVIDSLKRALHRCREHYDDRAIARTLIASGYDVPLQCVKCREFHPPNWFLFNHETDHPSQQICRTCRTYKSTIGWRPVSATPIPPILQQDARKVARYIASERRNRRLQAALNVINDTLDSCRCGRNFGATPAALVKRVKRLVTIIKILQHRHRAALAKESVA